MPRIRTNAGSYRPGRVQHQRGVTDFLLFITLSERFGREIGRGMPMSERDLSRLPPRSPHPYQSLIRPEFQRGGTRDSHSWCLCEQYPLGVLAPSSANTGSLHRLNRHVEVDSEEARVGCCEGRSLGPFGSEFPSPFPSASTRGEPVWGESRVWAETGPLSSLPGSAAPTSQCSVASSKQGRMSSTPGRELRSSIQHCSGILHRFWVNPRRAACSGFSGRTPSMIAFTRRASDVIAT